MNVNMILTTYEMDRNGKLSRIDDSAGRDLPLGTRLYWGGNRGWAACYYCIVQTVPGGYWCFNTDQSEKNARLYHVAHHDIKKEDDPSVWHRQHFFLSTSPAASAEEVAGFVAEHNRQAASLAAQEQVAEKECERLQAEGRAIWDAKIPADTTHVIIAERIVDDSRLEEDYFGEHTEKTIILAPSKHSRNNFAEMRKAAALIPETAHLGPGCGLFKVRVCFAVDIEDNGRYYGKGQHSPWHHNLDDPALPYGTPRSFTTRQAAEAWIAQAPKPQDIGCGGKTATFCWDIEEVQTEYRANYSGGKGYYLQAGYGGGWRVSKTSATRSTRNEQTRKHESTGEPLSWVLVALAKQHAHVVIK